MTGTAASAMISNVEESRVLVLERVFKAPRELVFGAFSQAEHLRQWWGPRGWEVPFCTVDFRPGGRWHYCMRCTDKTQGEFYGMESWGLGIYREIEVPARLSLTDSFSDAEGNVNETMPSTLSTLTFETVEGGTRVVNRAVYDSEEALRTVMEMGMVQGVTETWDRLAEYLETRQT
ncbi:SRPBCC domain-containing protein [Deinococcus aestuarii]|uniref:SRPBCC domain-containing protein n=1 Tax=Deinococcus aestuarii TaxID=2774531 RepID=UPI001C0DC9C3|nr:SRPBCC domain-containing protein [Deinococcus aestuarii]